MLVIRDSARVNDNVSVRASASVRARGTRTDRVRVRLSVQC